MGILVALGAKNHEIFGRVITQSASRLNMVDLKILHAPARLATPAIALQNFPTELAISLWVKPQAGSVRADLRQSVTCTSSRNCFLCGFGSPMTSRVRHGNNASRLPTSKLTPARKSAQIISKQ
jgi:hypothetical protein